jgi:hypothetical protein
MTPEPYYHEDSGAVRFWVPIDGQVVGSSVSSRTLHFRFRPGASDDVPLETYKRHAEDLHAAVRRRVAAGSIEPVMLREHDLRPDAA